MNLRLSWLLIAAALVLLAAFMGRTGGDWRLAGFVKDNRGRVSLSQTQMFVWTIVILSLVAAIAIARLIADVPDPLNIVIPPDLLAVMGISVGSGAAASGIKSAKDKEGAKIRTGRPNLTQLYTMEEGSSGEAVMDITRFQNLSITILLVLIYVGTVSRYLAALDIVEPVELPAFGSGMVTLFAISHAGYLAGKLPSRP